MDNNIELLNNILNSNTHDDRPSIDNPKWHPHGDYHIITSKHHKKYRITESLYKQMHDFSNVYRQANEKLEDKGKIKINGDHKDKIATVYLLQDKESDYKYIGYTTNSFVSFIKLNMHNLNIAEDNVFDNFGFTSGSTGNSDLSNCEFRVLEYVKYNGRADINSRCEVYKDEYFGNSSNTPPNPTGTLLDNDNDLDKFMKVENCVTEKMLQSRMDVFYGALGKYNSMFSPFKGYIYEIHNKKNNKKFIGGYREELLKKEVLDLIVKKTDNSRIKNDICRYGRRTFDVKLIEEYNAKTPFDFMLRIDYLKTRDDTIDGGYNMDYCLEESQDLFKKRLSTSKKDQITRSFFLKIQRLIFNKDFKDQLDYADIYGYTYQIKNKKNGKRYIAYTHGKTLKQVIKKLYNDAGKGNVKHNKILIALSAEPFEDFHFKIKKIKTHDDYKTDLHDEAEKLVRKYNTITDGYNFDVHVLKKNILMSKYYN